MKEDGTEALEIVVRSCKHDGRVQRSWPARVARRAGPLFVLDAFFAEEIRHDLIGTIEAGTLSTEFFWTDRWYSVFRFQTPGGGLLKFYCNINTPPTFAQNFLTFVDLDVDVLVQPESGTGSSLSTSSDDLRVRWNANFNHTNNSKCDAGGRAQVTFEGSARRLLNAYL
jgi:protein associated with RNAse G/E